MAPPNGGQSRPKTDDPTVPECQPGEPTTAKCCLHGEQRVRVVSKVGPTRSAEGGYTWSVQWLLPAKACGGGWVIQEVAKAATYEGSSVPSGAKHFWEAWPVPAYSTVTQRLFDDTYGLPHEVGRVAVSVRVLGFVKFYEMDPNPDNPPPGFRYPRPGELVESGLLAFTYQRPKFWSRFGATEHNLTREWDSRAQPNRDELWGEIDGTRVPATP
jgi:hypothetical protein